jgi:hypothetical protein
LRKNYHIKKKRKKTLQVSKGKFLIKKDVEEKNKEN